MGTRLRNIFRNRRSKDSISSSPVSPGFGKISEFQCVICFENYSSLEGFISCKPFESNVTSPKEPHRLCIDCIRGHSHAAIDMNLAPGGIGLRCPDPNCKNVLHFADFKFYLNPEDHEQLEKRMQHESVTSASLSDLVTCSSCSLQSCVDEVYYYFTCECGRTQCRNCPRPYDENHEGKACEELQEEEEQNGNQIESKLSEIVVRVCHRCNVQYVKQDGCNKMTCRCGATQCYICREKDINYEHFCDCETRQIHGKCPKCNKSCRLFENAEELDEARMKQLIRQGIDEVESHYEAIPIPPPIPIYNNNNMDQQKQGYYEILVDELCSKLALVESIDEIEKDALRKLKDANRQELNLIQQRCQAFRLKAEERVDEIKRILKSLET